MSGESEPRAGIETGDLAHLIDQVRTDPDLSPSEQETVIRWTGDDDSATIYTEERGVMLSILRSPVARINELRVSDEDRFGARVLPKEYQEGSVTGVKATVPIGAVLVKSASRSSNQRSRVVSDHAPEETTEE
jgi:hypothetical protein